MDLSDVQNEIFNSNYNLIITAGAGSGKTRVLVEKYIKVFEDDPTLRMDQVVAITFTEKATREMKERITQRINENISSNNDKAELYKKMKRELPFARISTIHSFCSRIIRESSLYANVDPDFTVVSGLGSFRRISRFIESYMIDNVKEIKKFFEIDPTIAFSNLRGWLEDAVSKRTNDDILPSDIGANLKDVFLYHANKLIEEYEKMEKDESTLDFEDLLIFTKELFEKNDELRERYSNYFRYIFVDEFQDTNKIQSEIIRLLRSDLNRVWYIGDPKQSIYAFRGANVGVFLDITEQADKNNVIMKEMNENHRSKPNLVKFYNSFFSKIFNVRIKYTNQVADGFDTEKRVVLLDNPGSENVSSARITEAKSIVGMINDFTSKGRALSDITILLRTTGDIWAIENELIENRIPYHVIGGKEFFSKKEVLALYNLMSVILDPYDVRAMTGLLMSAFFELTLDQVLSLKRKDNKIYDALKSDYPEIHELINELVKIKNTVDASKIIKTAINKTNYLGKIALQKDGDKRIANAVKFLEALDNLDVPSWDINGIQRIMEKGFDKDEEEASALSENENVVKIMTVHKSKGLEFPIVIMAQMAKKPRNEGETEAELEESKRLLYVGMTRAKEYLVLSKENSFGNGVRESIWMSILSSVKFLQNNKSWSIPEEFKDTAEIKSFSPKKMESKNVPYFPFEETYLKVPELKNEKYLYNVTELFEKADFKSSSKATVYGNIAHEMLEKVGPETLRNVLRENLFSVYPSEMIEEVKNDLSKLIDDPLVKEIENSKNVKSEFAIEAELFGIELIGKIDKVTDEKIIDFKYSYFSKEKLKGYEFQVKVYMMLYHKLTGIKKNGVIFFLKDGKKSEVNYPNEEQFMSELKNIDGR